MSAYEYRVVEPTDDVTRYAQLFRDAFGAAANKISTRYLRWLYQDCPHGPVIAVDALSGKDVVAHYAVVPRVYLSGSGQRTRVALSLNTATHPNHQGKGLFTKLAERTYALAVERGCAAVVGVANANSTHGFVKKLGFRMLGSVRVLATFASAPRLVDRLSAAAYDTELLRWRLSNPSGAYQLASSGDEVVIRTRVRSLPVILGMIPMAIAPPQAYVSRSTPMSRTGLVPYFGGPFGAGFDIPRRFQPSPWNVILRELRVNANLDALQVHGLDMDSF